MQNLESIRAWSRACHLVVEHYPSVLTCSDLVLRTELLSALLAIPVTLAKGITSKSTADLTAALEQAEKHCAEVKTYLFISRELEFIEVEPSDKLMLDAMHILELLRTTCTHLRRVRAEIKSSGKHSAV